MAKKKPTHWRTCSCCWHYAPELIPGPAWDKKERVECPSCGAMSFTLKTADQMAYLEWKGTIGAGRQLKQIIKEHNNA